MGFRNRLKDGRWTGQVAAAKEQPSNSAWLRLRSMRKRAHFELSKYVQFPGTNHMLGAENVLCYLRGTWNQTIRYSRDSHENPNVLWGWVDADWAGDTDTRRSHTGYILMMNVGPISWKSRRQDNVSLSTSEAEFVAATLRRRLILSADFERCVFHIFRLIVYIFSALLRYVKWF